jgi:phenylpyruvate tautomerase PptA (4-oxalocrotonate tautomerase family)
LDGALPTPGAGRLWFLAGRCGSWRHYNAGSPDHEKPFYFVEIRIPINRLDLLAKQGLIRDFTRVVLEAEGSDNTPANARRVWVTINELKVEDWGIGGHTDWLRDYTSALVTLAITKSPVIAREAMSPEMGDAFRAVVDKLKISADHDGA